MKKALVFSSLAAAAVGAMAQAAPQHQREMGRVLSTTPVVQQVPVTQQVCGNQQVMTQAPSTGAGAVLGAVAGGVLGNAIGHGGGRAAATALGLMGGAVLGNQVEGPGAAYVQNVPTCGTQTTFENRTVGYDVSYEYAGRQYTTRMASDPGQWVPVQVGALGDNGQQGLYESNPQAVYAQPGVVQSATVVTPYGAAPPVVYAPAYAPAYAPVYAPAPAYGYAPGYYGGGYGGVPIGLSLNLGYSRGYGHGYGGRRWR